MQEELAIKAFIRGIFLGSGSVNNPENKYHLEMILNTFENAKIVKVFTYIGLKKVLFILKKEKKYQNF